MKAKDIALGGILTSISIIILYLSSIIPINTLTLLTLTSCLIAIAIIHSSIKLGGLVYTTTSIIGFLILPTNIIISYILFFGLYSIIKNFIEKSKNIVKEIILKLISFNILFIIGYTVFSSFIGDINLSISPIIFIILAEIGFLIYDYALTLIITFYLSRIKNRL